MSAAGKQRRWDTENELQKIAVVERKVMMPMPDGVRLATDIYRPKNATGKVPTIWHTLRIEVSSSNFPRFDRNLNTGGNDYDESKGIVAHTVVHRSKRYPSSVTVTVVRRAVPPTAGQIR